MFQLIHYRGGLAICYAALSTWPSRGYWIVPGSVDPDYVDAQERHARKCTH